MRDRTTFVRPRRRLAVAVAAVIAGAATAPALAVLPASAAPGYTTCGTFRFSAGGVEFTPRKSEVVCR